MISNEIPGPGNPPAWRHPSRAEDDDDFPMSTGISGTLQGGKWLILHGHGEPVTAKHAPLSVVVSIALLALTA